MSRKTRKLIWSAPLVAVLAVAGALAMLVALAPNTAQADGAPGSVTGLNASDVGRHHIELSWTAPTTGTPTGYRIDMSSDGFVWMLRKDDTGSDATSYRVEQLDAATRYYFRVYALNGDHTGPLSIRPLNISVRTSLAVAPDVVTRLTATKDLEKMITLTWQQPAYNGGADVARYCISARGIQNAAVFVGLTVGNCGATVVATPDTAIGAAIDALNPTQTSLSGPIVVEPEDVEAEDGSATWTLSMANDMELEDGVTANFQVVAVNTAGNSVASNIAEGKTAPAADPAAVTAPGAPANLKLVGADTTGSNGNSVSFYWNSPADAGDAVQVQRQVYADKIGWLPINATGGWVEVEANTDAADTNGLVAADPPGNYAQFVDSESDIDVAAGEVRYRVRYTENDLASAWVDSPALSFPFPTSGVGEATTNLPVIKVDEPSDDPDVGGLQVVDDATYFKRIDLAWNRDSYCSVGDGDDTDSDCDTMSQSSTYAVDVIETDGNTPPGEATGAGADWDFLTDTISATRTKYEHHSSNNEDATMLVSDEVRHYRVFPWHAGRYGYPQVVMGNTKAATVPDRIANGGLRVTANGNTKLDLDWDETSVNGGSPVTSYIIQVSTDRDNNNALAVGATWCDVEHQPVADGRMYTYDGDIYSTAVLNCSGTAAPLTTRGEALAAGYGRWFRVIPLNKKSTEPDADIDGWAIDSDSGNAIPAFGWTGRAAPLAEGEKPGAPIGLVAETALNVHSGLATDKGVLLTWDVPMETGTTTITDYVVQVSVDGSAWSTLEDGVGDDATDWTHSDPLPTATEERAYQVAAVNSVGMGPWSNMAHYSTMSMTDPDHMHPPATAALTEPTGVTATSDTDGALTVMWMGGDNADRYIIIALERGSSPLVIKYVLAESDASEATITGLNSDASHLVIVLALKGTGDDRELKYGTDTVTVQ